MRKLFLIIVLTVSTTVMYAGFPVRIHSHNDYCQDVPFWEAYAHGLSSVEADVFLKNGTFLLGHDKCDLDSENTLRKVYLDPIAEAAKKDKDFDMTLMIEFKNKPEESLEALINLLDQYKIFKKGRVRIVITGKNPANMLESPEYITFDGDINRTYTDEELKKISMFSACLRSYTDWNGKGALKPDQEAAVRAVIVKAHSLGKTIRFWEAPECTTAYYTLYDFGVDWINTDHPATCAAFFSDWENKNFQKGVKPSGNGVASASKLDRATSGFEGFRGGKLYLDKPVETYMPEYRNDGTDIPVRNVILMIGDGMGLNQISAGMYANGGLTILNMRNMGLQQNNSADQFTTDSAAAGSALATGKSHLNRHIAMDADGTPNESLTDWFSGLGFSTGVVTWGDVMDATPASFFGHSKERDNSEELREGLVSGRLNLLCGCADICFKTLKEEYNLIKDSGRIDSTPGNVICIDKRFEDPTDTDNMTLLADATRRSLKKLENEGEGFFLMVEGAKIDYAGHAECLPGVVLETLGFDLAVAEALKYADANPGTLVIVTGDHETGGLILLDGDKENGRIFGLFNSDDHSPSLLPVFAYGAHSDAFTGKYLNTDIAKKIKELTGNNK